MGEDEYGTDSLDLEEMVAFYADIIWNEMKIQYL